MADGYRLSKGSGDSYLEVIKFVSDVFQYSLRVGSTRGDGFNLDFVPVATQSDKTKMRKGIGIYMGGDAGQMGPVRLGFVGQGMLQNHLRRLAFRTLAAGHFAVKRPFCFQVARQEVKRHPHFPLVS